MAIFVGHKSYEWCIFAIKHHCSKWKKPKLLYISDDSDFVWERMENVKI